MHYFDNAATTFPKPKCVLTEVYNCIKNYCGNPGRSTHVLAEKTAEKIYDTREILGKFLGAEAENIVFTQNATYALNLAIKGCITQKCHIITSDMEHNSVLRPLYKSADKYDCSISYFDSSLPPDKSIPPLIQKDTKILVSTLASNVTGKIINADILSNISKKYGLYLILDASQYLGHRKIDLNNINYNILCSAGHKSLFGIQGSGIVVFKNPDIIDTIAEGGSGFDTFSKKMPDILPERYEAGTLSAPSIISLYAGVNYIMDIGIDNINAYIDKLTSRLDDICNSVKNIEIYGIENGIAAINLKGINSSVLSSKLDKCGIATRSGFHCAPMAHKKIGTEDKGAVRISVSYLNSESELDILYKTLNEISFLI